MLEEGGGRREECRVDLSQHPDTAMAVKRRDHLLTILALIVIIKLYGKLEVYTDNRYR